MGDLGRRPMVPPILATSVPAAVKRVAALWRSWQRGPRPGPRAGGVRRRRTSRLSGCRGRAAPRGSWATPARPSGGVGRNRSRAPALSRSPAIRPDSRSITFRVMARRPARDGLANSVRDGDLEVVTPNVLGFAWWGRRGWSPRSPARQDRAHTAGGRCLAGDPSGDPRGLSESPAGSRQVARVRAGRRRRFGVQTLLKARNRRNLAEGEGFEPPVGVEPTPVFKTGAFDRSAIPPRLGFPGYRDQRPAGRFESARAARSGRQSRRGRTTARRALSPRAPQGMSTVAFVRPPAFTRPGLQNAVETKSSISSASYQAT